MDEEGRKEFMNDFTKAEGGTRLDMWDYAVSQQVLWEQIIADIQEIAREQGVDKKLDQMMQDDMKKLD